MPVKKRIVKTDSPKKATRQSGVGRTVLEYLRTYKNQEVHMSDIAKDTGLTDQQVSNAVANMRHQGIWNIESVSAGWYRFRGANKIANGKVVPKGTAEVLRELADGSILLDIDGVLFIANELPTS